MEKKLKQKVSAAAFRALAAVFAALMMVTSLQCLPCGALKASAASEKVWLCTEKSVDEYGTKTTYKYDKYGRLTESKYTSPNGLFSDAAETESYAYNKYGDITRHKEKEVVSKWIDKLNSSSSVTYTYDKSRNLTGSEEKDGKKVYCVRSYKYDKSGNLTQSVKKVTGGSTVKTVYTYDKKGNVVKVSEFNGKDLEYSEQNTYDSKNRLTKEVTTYTYSDDGQSDETSFTIDTYKYDKNGNVTRNRYEDEDGLYSDVTCTYDSKGRPTKDVLKQKVFYSSGDKVEERYETTKTTYTYEGRTTTIAAVCDSGDSSIRTIVTDKKGRVVKDDTSLTTAISGYKIEEKIIQRMTYDKYGNLTKVKSTTTGGSSKTSSVCTYKYEQFTVTKPGTVSVLTGGDGITDDDSIDAEIKIGSSVYTYTGKSIEPVVSVCSSSSSDERYFKGVDYKVKYVNNKKVGTAKAIVTFTEPYMQAKSYTLTFKIVPEKPKAKVKSRTSSSVTLSWNKCAGASEYIIYKSEDSKSYKKVGTTKKTSFSVGKLRLTEKKYKFRICASDSSGKYKSAYCTLSASCAQKNTSVKTK